MPVHDGVVSVEHELFEDYRDAGLAFNPARHELLPDGYWIKMVRDNLKMPNLFVYRHREIGSFVLAGWTYQMGDLRTCIEIWTMGGPPGWDSTTDAPTMADLRRITRPVQEQAAERMQILRASAASQTSIKEATLLERVDRGNSLIRRGYEQAGKDLRDGYTPFVGEVEGGADLVQIKEDLKISAKVADK